MKILVVDDERDIQTLFEQRFRKEIREKSLEFVFAFSGEDALIYLKKCKPTRLLMMIILYKKIVTELSVRLISFQLFHFGQLPIHNK